MIEVGTETSWRPGDDPGVVQLKDFRLKNNMSPRNPELRQLSRARYSVEDVAQIRDLLIKRGTLSFPALPNGLYSAASLSQHAAHTGYQGVWVRDNVYVAYSLLANGETGKAAAAVLALADHFQRQASRFDAIIADPSRAANPVNRPHVKFNGYPVGEVDTWPHDQNDALGYFLWIFSRMARLNLIPGQPESRRGDRAFP